MPDCIRVRIRDFWRNSTRWFQSEHQDASKKYLEKLVAGTRTDNSSPNWEESYSMSILDAR
jgi:hypothetical protein